MGKLQKTIYIIMCSFLLFVCSNGEAKGVDKQFYEQMSKLPSAKLNERAAYYSREGSNPDSAFVCYSLVTRRLHNNMSQQELEYTARAWHGLWYIYYVRVPLQQSLVIGVASFDLRGAFSEKEALANKLIEQVFQSRLMENIRQKEGGVYAIQAHGETNYLPTGSLEISAEYQASPADVKRIQQKIIGEWKNMVQAGISVGEMDRVANFLKLKVVQDNRKAETWAESLATQYLCGRQVLTPMSSRPLLATLTLADINALLKKYEQQGTSMSGCSNRDF